MNNNLIPFQFENNSIRVITDENGEVWFVGKDICDALGYINHKKAMTDHCRGVTKRYPIPDGLGRVQDTRIINEPDMLRLIVNSRLPAAMQFERLVFEEILPAIRKTGSYSHQSSPKRSNPSFQSEIKGYLDICNTMMKKVVGVNPTVAFAAGLEAIRVNMGVDVAPFAKALPKEDLGNIATLNATDVGKRVDLKGRGVNLLLSQLGLIYRDDRHDWRLTEAGTAFGEMKPFHRNGHTGYEIRWKESVIDVLLNHLTQPTE